MSEKRLFNDDEVLECANMAIALQREVKKQREELARLSSFNREMVATFLLIHDLSWDRFNTPTIREKCNKMIAKADGE